MVDVSVCIVNWNTREHLNECLRSLRQEVGGVEIEVVVVDNASGDGSAEMVRDKHPWVKLLAQEENTGYAAGNNIALQETGGRYKLLLNADIVVRPGSVEYLVDFLDRHEKAGAVAPRLRHKDGSIQRTCRSFPDPEVVLYEALGLSRLFARSRRFGKYRMSWWDYDDERMVEQPMASALMLRAETLTEVGLFDESFSIFCNDVDLCRRLWDEGWEVWFTPEAEMVHEGGASTRQVRREMIVESHRSMMRYYEKHYRGKVCGPVYGLALAALRAGMYMRLLVHALRGRR
jgi:GT2 family glycosyltransferase